ncbi:hypothetical protein C1894_13190 [Pseudomonas sp. FW305-3-2-15-E-TSA2]|nr:hypothetical protein C1894_13190 [Pseudomonas sp. FW305-3-2-15-E-TSA2]
MGSAVAFEAEGRSYRLLQFQCGSEPARESGGSVTLILNVLPPSRAGSLPQGEFVLCQAGSASVA